MFLGVEIAFMINFRLTSTLAFALICLPLSAATFSIANTGVDSVGNILPLGVADPDYILVTKPGASQVLGSSGVRYHHSAYISPTVPTRHFSRRKQAVVLALADFMCTGQPSTSLA